ncbi:hypothetical protein K438DRAFT_1768838 [Mycena galopus ATCC 62051]|nr:hypothetical protein K438DRAFT_1768838 [Mycena galopus ATCC 62051]
MTTTRKYTTSRLCSTHGYDELPVVNKSLQHRLPPFSSFCAHIVHQEGWKWLCSLPRFSNGNMMGTEADGISRDSRTFSPTCPWLGLMKREGRHSETEHEFTPPYTVWNDQAGEINQEYLDLLITCNTTLEEAMSLRIPTVQRAQPPLHAQWPVFSKLQNLNDLKVVNSFNQAVDKLGKCQRGMREKQVWVMLITLLVGFPLESEACCNPRVKTADDALVEVWINGAEDKAVMSRALL